MLRRNPNLLWKAPFLGAGALFAVATFLGYTLAEGQSSESSDELSPPPFASEEVSPDDVVCGGWHEEPWPDDGNIGPLVESVTADDEVPDSIIGGKIIDENRGILLGDRSSKEKEGAQVPKACHIVNTEN